MKAMTMATHFLLKKDIRGYLLKSASYLKELLLEFALDPAKLDFSLGAFGAALILHLADFLQRRNKLLIGVLERLDVYYAALGLPCHLDGAGTQRLSVFTQELIRDVAHLALGVHGLL